MTVKHSRSGPPPTVVYKSLYLHYMTITETCHS